MKSINTYILGTFLLILAQSLIGLNIVLTKQLVMNVPFFTLLTIRFALASFILLPLHWMTPARKTNLKQHFLNITRKDWLFIVAQALSAGCFFNCFMLLGLHYTDANIAGIITSSLPAIIAVMAWLFLRVKITNKQLFCIVFATLGLVMIALTKDQKIVSHSFFGDLMVLLSLIPEASYYIFCKMHQARLPVFLFCSLMNAINALVLIPALFFQDTSLNLNEHQWHLLILLGFNTGMFYVLWYYSAQWVDSVMTSLTTAVMPIVTVLFAWALLGEHLNLGECLGMSLVLFSIVLYAKKEKRVLPKVSVFTSTIKFLNSLNRERASKATRTNDSYRKITEEID